jgi:hypothetical protein
MPAVASSDVGDLIKLTQKELGPMKLTDLTTDIQKHVALSQLLKGNRETLKSGTSIQFTLMIDHNDSVRPVGYGAEDIVDIPDLTALGEVGWKKCTGNWALEHALVDMNRDPARIVDMVKVQRLGCLIAFAEWFEDKFWRSPGSSSALEPNGVAHYVVKSASEGFTTNAPTGFTTVANINPSTGANGRWRNWAAPYTQVTKDGLIAAARKAAFYTDWEPAVPNMPQFNTGDKYGFYSNYATVGALELVLESQNDNLGSDVASQDGKVLFKRSPITPVIKLDSDTTNPLYGINWGEFKTVVLSGWWMRETSIDIQPGQHTISATHVDCQFNWITRNRRRHFVISNGTTDMA